jgi:hypothetical protein
MSIAYEGLPDTLGIKLPVFSEAGEEGVTVMFGILK